MEGVDGVFHVAAWYKIGARDGGDVAERVNVEGTRNVLEVARELAIRRIVYTSTVGVFGDTRGQLVDETYYAERAVSHRVRPHANGSRTTKWRCR